ncbi:MAG: putative CRISPR-associated protein [Nitrospirae bacterium]|nr:putative CRISPR-associated protein [Nitrospirota bacterium]
MNTLFLCPSGISIKDNIKKLFDFSELDNDATIFLKDADDNTLMQLSAEINSLFRMGLTSDDKIMFLTSDTDAGESVANVLANILESRRKCKVTVKRIKGLQTDDRKQFDTVGIPTLTDVIINEVENNRYTFNIVLNATAGFKATIPYITFIGMIFHLPIRYIFERSESIIELPPMPLEFDIERLKQLEPVIDKIFSDYISTNDFMQITGFSYEDLRLAAQDILLEEDGLVTLRSTGRILYQRYLQVKGSKAFISPTVLKKLSSGEYNKGLFEGLFNKMKDPIHVQSKLHNEVKRKGIDLDCYKPGATSERIFFFMEDKKIYICDIFLHDEYEKLLERGELLRDKFEKEKRLFKEIKS